MNATALKNLIDEAFGIVQTLEHEHVALKKLPADELHALKMQIAEHRANEAYRAAAHLAKAFNILRRLDKLEVNK